MKLIKAFLIYIVAFIIFNTLSVLSFVFQIFRKTLRGESISEYLICLAIGEDQRGGSYLYGTEDYTISSYTYILHARGNKYATWFMKFIDFFARYLQNKDRHCEKAYNYEHHTLRRKGV